MLRDQAIIQVQVYPIQYNPISSEIRLYKRIVARIIWDDDRSKAASFSRAFNPTYEGMMRDAIINYDALERRSRLVAPAMDNLAPSKIVASTAAGQALKIGVTQDGMYRITPVNLTANGFDLTGIDPANIQITNRGQEIPIYMQEDGNGSFDGSDYILFYGTAITDVYTTENIYWLTVGASPGARMSARDVAPGSAPVAQKFPVTLHAEKDTDYWQTMPDGAGQDHWFWEDRISPNSSDLPQYRDYPFTINFKDSVNTEKMLRVRLKGFTSITSLNPDHSTQISLNGTLIGSATWDSFAVFDLELSYNTGLLVEGTNTLSVTALDSGAVVDQYFVNYFEIEYVNSYTAANNELWFGVPSTGLQQFQVTGFATGDVQVFDITDPGNVAKLTGVVVDGTNTTKFEDTATLETRYLALTASRFKQPASFKLDQPSSLKTNSSGADYIIITPASFYANIMPLALYRESAAGGSHTTVVVDIEDVYDEFNAGIFNPQAIRDFLTYAYQNWQPAPTYVLLVGEASYDYRNLLNLGRKNLVPTQMIETFLLGQTASDNWFVEISGSDVLPDMVIGRFTARNSNDVIEMVNKTIYYEQNPPDETWSKKGLFIADDDEIGFEQLSESLISRMPPFYSPQRVYLKNYTQGQDPTVDITNGINSGRLLVNYAGHGNPTLWAGSAVFNVNDVNALNNTNKLSVVTVGNCLSGFFVGKDPASMAEAFLSLPGNKGAVAVFAPTGVGYAYAHKALLVEFYDAIFKDDIYELGMVATVAKIKMYSNNSGLAELVKTYVFFGDPATKITVTPSKEMYIPFVKR